MYLPQHGHPVLAGGKDAVPSPAIASALESINAAPAAAVSPTHDHAPLSASQVKLRQQLIFDLQLVAAQLTAQPMVLKNLPAYGAVEVCLNVAEILQHSLTALQENALTVPDEEADFVPAGSKAARDGSCPLRCATENRIRNMSIKAASTDYDIAQATGQQLDMLAMLEAVNPDQPERTRKIYLDWLGATGIVRLEGELDYAAHAGAATAPARPVAVTDNARQKYLERHLRRHPELRAA